MTRYKPYNHQNIGEMMDHLGMMMTSSPTFKDDYFTERNVDTVFSSLDAGIENIRQNVGENRYALLRELSKRMRAHFEADPEDKTDDSLSGRQLIHEMEDVLKSIRKRKST